MSKEDELELMKQQHDLEQYIMPSAASTPAQASPADDKSNTDDDDDDDSDEQARIAGQPVVLDDAKIALAQAVARTPWYASWVTGALIPGAPLLALAMGIFAGSSMLIDWSSLAIILLVLIGPVIGSIWLALFLSHRRRVKYIRQAIGLRRAWVLTGPLDRLGRRTILVANQAIETVHGFRIPDSAYTGQCTVVLADGNLGAADDSAQTRESQLIAVTGPDGRQIYPPTGLVPSVLRVPALLASVLVSIAFTNACNAQAQAYSDAATRLHDIDAATQCMPSNKPSDDCWKWVPGTIAYEGYYTTTTLNGSTRSTCRSVLRWENKRQEGDLRIEGIDCKTQLTTNPMPARIQVLRDYAIQVQVGQSTYKTDRWPPLGETAITLALITRLATILWFAWPIVHIIASIVYRLRRTIGAPQLGTPSPPAAEPV